MKSDGLNNCPRLYFHKSITDTLNSVDFAEVCLCKQRKRHFGKYEQKDALDLTLSSLMFQNVPPTLKHSVKLRQETIV